MSNDKMREEFEVALRQAISQGICVAEDSAVAWAFFAASREALVIEPPEDFTAGGNPNARVLISHHREIVGRWVRSIKAAGVKVKP